ncbi:hypothetical protein A2634_01210 [Candidatus Amesbacteria bacterium RIFCSPHIGHO2_01_FULL_48_32]|uniref:Uncharacterized protein n=1 Tax=Candidatus Amesbacteria bacterium RIFCSPLOWO2_01_FULL_48_25 TaxID=1797259 RepID=A0A1F4ZBA9_9BACT|nr:MAG: hypothetical protein A2634_01210 [Candidatus Amesbacteria bacterium RIFCSPHIGHO2_01_FULL_48_32]OGD03660.1 MAG: hypothetical protein A2989_03195 [Candidatus Amesbacteria bacterium RIFCSPLOWO2_01_FULL_48_25]HJZ05991.1 hypothetical protein [Patescibacteria group bacterium]
MAAENGSFEWLDKLEFKRSGGQVLNPGCDPGRHACADGCVVESGLRWEVRMGLIKNSVQVKEYLERQPCPVFAVVVTKAMGKEAKIVVSVEEFKRRLEKERKKKADLDAQIAQARANGGKGVAGLEKKRKQSGSVIGAIVTNLKRLNKARGSDHDAEVMD